MDFLKELFGEEAITYEQFSSAVKERGFKVADLSTGNYVAKKKFDDELSAKDKIIEDLNGQIEGRNTDIENLKTQLEDAGHDAKKVAEVTAQLTKLQGDYENAKADYENKLSKQSYEFAVKEFSNTQKFTSAAARREFEREMISANLKMQDKSIIGADDFAKLYRENNADSFVVEAPKGSEGEAPKPTFGQPTPPQPGNETNPFEFNFAGVR